MGEFYIKAGNFIDVITGRMDHDIILKINDKKIEKVEKNLSLPADAIVYDYSAKTVMPGMMNCHVHIGFVEPYGNDAPNELEIMLSAIRDLQRMLRAGVTYVRICGGSTYLDLKLKKAALRGEFVCPGILAAGRGITMTGGSGHYCEIEADGVDACRKAARFVMKQGGEFLKIVSTGSITTKGIEPGAEQLSEPELRAAIEEVHKYGRTAATHAEGMAGIKNAILAGVDSIEHGTFLSDEEIEMMKERGTWHVPTLSAPYFLLIAGENGKLTDFQYRKAKETAPAWFDSFRRSYQAGVKIAMGSDCYGDTIKGEDTWHELRLMVENGMSPMEAIQASSVNAAELMQIAETHGSLSEGKAADILVVDGNPLEDICALSKVHAVFKDGAKVTA